MKLIKNFPRLKNMLSNYFLCRPTGLTTSFKTKNEEANKININAANFQGNFGVGSSESNRRIQIKNCEIDLNLKKDVTRPISAKIESRSRMPGANINISQRNEIVNRISPSRIPLNSNKNNYAPINLIQNNRLKSSPSSNSIASNKSNSVQKK